MDTIIMLEGEIGRENLSTQAKKRIKAYNRLKAQVSKIKTAYENADKEDEKNYEGQLKEATDNLNDFYLDTESFLKDELADFSQKKAEKEAKERLAQEEKDKIKAEKEQKAKEEKAKADKIKADKEAKILKDKKAKEEKEKEATEKLEQEKLEKEKLTKEKEEKKSGIGIGGLIFGGIVLIGTFGAINYFKNK